MSAINNNFGGASVPFSMVLDKDVAVPMRDGAILRANVFRPDGEGEFPALMTFITARTSTSASSCLKHGIT